MKRVKQLCFVNPQSNSTQTEFKLGNKFKYRLQVINQNDSNHHKKYYVLIRVFYICPLISASQQSLLQLWPVRRTLYSPFTNKDIEDQQA